MSNQEKKHTTLPRLLANPWLNGLIIFLLLAFTCSFLVYQHYRIQQNEEERNADLVAESIHNQLQQSLQQSLSATHVLALTLNADGLPVNFDSVAAYIQHTNKSIEILQLTPAGIVQYVYPKQDNEHLMGYNFINDPINNAQALASIKNREPFFTGPSLMNAGEYSITGSLPVYKYKRFWGFASVVIRLSSLMDLAGMDTTGKSGYYYQLSKKDPLTGREQFFLPQHKNVPGSDVRIISTLGENWKLTLIPVSGYKSLKATLPLAFLGLILSIIGGIFAGYASKTPARLQQLVLQRTAELDRSEKRNKAIVNALPDFAIVINQDNEFTDFQNPVGHPTILPQQDLVGSKITNFLPAALATEIIDHKDQVLQDGKVAHHSFQLQVNDVLRSYEARYAQQGKEDVLMLVRDVTDIRKAEESRKESEDRYRTLVEQATDAIFIADFTGKLLVVNPATSKIALYSQEELLSMRIHDLVILEDLDKMPFRFEEIATGATVHTERKIRQKNGTYIQVEITAKIIAADRFLVFARDISERKKVETALLKSREDLRHLSNYIENIREQERLHMSREIHEELGQLLTVLKMDVARMAKKIGAENQAASNEIHQILQAINNMVNIVRRIATELRPGLLDDLGLLAALDWYCSDFQLKTGIQTSFVSGITEEELPMGLTVGIFRTLQESLSNVASHSQASRADISLMRQGQELVLLIEDNGNGYPLTPADPEKGTLRIMGLQERAIMMGGTYSIHSNPGKGTVIEVIIPFSGS